MKRCIAIFGIVAFVFFNSACAMAAGKLSCRDLDDVASDLDVVSFVFDVDGKYEIREDDEIDRDLGILVDHLQIIADIENERRLDRLVDSLTDAYDDMDAEVFIMYLDKISAELDRIQDRDCF